MVSDERRGNEPPRGGERDLEVGDRFGRYLIEGVVGEGGMGRVYAAMDTLLERRIALKVILPSGSEDHAAVATTRLLREAKAVAALDHPNVVAIFDVGELDGVSFIAMELIRGRSLRSFVASRSPGWQERLRWLVDVARALSAAHQVGLIHRDIKPDNVMIRDDGRVKVLDFGIARRASSPAEPIGNMPVAGIATITADGVQIGTPLYMAPEQVRAEPLDARSDQFSWGVLAYELLGGTPPWSGDVREIMRAILIQEPRHLRAVRPEIPEDVAAVVMRALVKKPRARWPSMNSIITALQPFVGSVLVTAPEKVDINAADPHATTVEAGSTATDPHATTVEAGTKASEPHATTVEAGTKASEPHATTMKAAEGAVTSPPETPVRPEQTPANERSPSLSPSFQTPPLATASPTDPIPRQALAPSEPSSRRRWLLGAAGAVGAISLAGVLAFVVLLRQSPDAPPQAKGRPEVSALRCAPATVTGEADPAIAKALGTSACARLGLEVGVPWGDPDESVPVVNTTVTFGPEVEVAVEVRGERASARGATPIQALSRAVTVLSAAVAAPPLSERDVKAWGAKDEAAARRIERAWRKRSLWIGGDGSPDAKALLETDADSPMPHLLLLLSGTAGRASVESAGKTALSLADKLPPARQSALRGALLALPEETNRSEAVRYMRIAYAEAPGDTDIAALFAAFAVRWDLPEAYGALDRLVSNAPARSLLALESALTRTPKRDLDRMARYAAKAGEIFPEARVTPPVIRALVGQGKLDEARAALAFGRKLGLDKAPLEPLVYTDSALLVELAAGNAAAASKLAIEMLGDPAPLWQVVGAHGVASSLLLEGKTSQAEAELWQSADRHKSTGDTRAAVSFAVRALGVRRHLKQQPVGASRLDWLRAVLSDGTGIPLPQKAEGLVELALTATGMQTFRIRTEALKEIETLADSLPESEVARRQEILVKTIPLVRALQGDLLAIERWRATEEAPFAARLRPAFDAALALDRTGDFKGALAAYELAADAWNLRDAMLERMLALHRMSKLLTHMQKYPEGAARKKEFDDLWMGAEPAARTALEIIR